MTNFNCRICRSSVKKKIEEEVAGGKGFREVAKQYLNHFPCELHLLEQSISTHIKKHVNNNHSNELTQEDIELLEQFENGKLGFDDMQRHLARRAFAKILKNPDAVQVRDWLQSEMVKIKMSDLEAQKDRMGNALAALFGGYLPPQYCPNCSHDLQHSWQIGERIKDEKGHNPYTD